MRRPRVPGGDELVEAQLLERVADGRQLGGAQLDQRLALADQRERLVEARLAGVQAADDLLDARRRRLVAELLARRLGSAPGRVRRSSCASVAGERAVGEPQPQLAGLARGCGASTSGSPCGDCDEHVAALERALRVVAGERERELRSSSRGRRSRQSSSAEAALRSSTTRAALGQLPLGLDAPARAGADLAQLLVQARALALEVRGGRARERREQARARRAPAAQRWRRVRRASARGALAQRCCASCGACARSPRRRPPRRRGSGVEQLTAATSSSSVRSVW